MTAEWKMVPVEPTDAMLSAAVKNESKYDGVTESHAEIIWTKMLAASPSPPSGSDVGKRLIEIRERADAATAGPWCIEACGEKGDGSNMIGVAFDTETDEECEHPLSGWVPAYRPGTDREIEYYRDELVAECEHRNRNSNCDATFIAHAREDIPFLLALIARLEAENKELRRASTDLLDKMELEAKAQSRLERMFENADAYSTPELEQAKDATCDAICAASEAITALKAALSPKSQTNGETEQESETNA